MNVRRPLTVLAATAASLALAAGPASAHFCYFKDLTPQAVAGMGGSSGFITFETIATEFIGLCPAGADLLADVADMPLDTLINAHGLMAGGLEKQGRTNKTIGHLDVDAIEAAIPDAFAICEGTAS